MRLPRTLKGRIAAIVAAALILVLVLSQLFAPGLGERAVRDRLTENGGEADVSISAFPAAKLLLGDGDSLHVDGHGLRLAVDRDDPAVLENLDRFGDVDIEMQDVAAGPLQIDELTLTRHGDSPYTLRARTSTSASRLAAYGIDQAELPGAGIIGTVLDFTGLGGEDIPVDLGLQIRSDDGRVDVIGGGGTVAGVPTGPLAELIASAVAIRP